MPERATGAGDLHQRVEHRRRSLRVRVRAVAARLEADAVDGRVDLGHAEQVCSIWSGGVARARRRRSRSRSSAPASRRSGIEVADDDDGGAEQLRRGGGGQPDRAGAGDVHRRCRRSTPAVTAPWKPVGKMSESIVRSAIFSIAWSRVGEPQQVPVGVGDHDVLGLAADPAAHVDVAVGGARPGRVDVEADAGLALLAVAAATAGDVERHRDDVADLDELDVRAGLDHLAGDLVAEDQPVRARWSGRGPCAGRCRRCWWRAPSGSRRGGTCGRRWPGSLPDRPAAPASG